MQDGNGASQRAAELLAAAVRWAREARRILGLYLDDLLMAAAGVCCVCGVGELLGRPWALLTAGGWLVICAVLVAKARRGGGGG